MYAFMPLFADRKEENTKRAAVVHLSSQHPPPRSIQHLLADKLKKTYQRGMSDCATTSDISSAAETPDCFHCVMVDHAAPLAGSSRYKRFLKVTDAQITKRQKIAACEQYKTPDKNNEVTPLEHDEITTNPLRFADLYGMKQLRLTNETPILRVYFHSARYDTLKSDNDTIIRCRWLNVNELQEEYKSVNQAAEAIRECKGKMAVNIWDKSFSIDPSGLTDIKSLRKTSFESYTRIVEE